MSSDADKKKYDRQIRIWGAHGQAKLEAARVCLLHAGPTGSETLKNLVLGGIAAFTVVDDARVQASDLGNNFLLDASCLGKSRAQCVTELLKELNPSVSGSFVDDSLANILDTRKDFFKDFRLVVAAQIGEQLAIRLDKVCRAHGIALICARSYGLVGYLRPSIAEHQVIESKPDYPEEDLRLHRPWPALEEFADSVALDLLDDAAHAHVPFAVLLIKAVQTWRASRGEKLPANAKEKAAFKEIIKGWQRKADGIAIEEDNFTEALESRRLFKLYSPPGIPSTVRSILEDPAAEVAGKQAPDFWILVAALKQFVEEEGRGNLPLEGSIPDMTSTTAAYLQLQKLFRERAEGDVAALVARVQVLEQSSGRSAPKIPATLVRHFAKNARNLRLIRYSSIAEEVQRGGGEPLRAAAEREDEKADAALYLLLRAVDRFQAMHNRFPGSFDSSLEEDVALLKTVAASVAAEAGVGQAAIPDDYVGEMVRFGASELHPVAAVVGGIAAQEAIKLLTAQFVPLLGTLVYNAMAGTSLVLAA